MFVSRDPFDGQRVRSFRRHSTPRLLAIADRVAVAQMRWGATAVDERAACLGRLGQALRDNRQALAATLTSEMGKRTVEALAEVDKCAATCEFYALHGPAFLEPEQLAGDAGFGHVEYPPAGTVLAIMPWNFPLWQLVRCVVPALLAGCGVLAKPAPSTPTTAFLLESLLRDVCGIPELFRVVLADPAGVESLIAHPAVAVVSLTGSEQAGRAVASIAGRHLKRCVMELGGSDPFIVFADADVSAAAARAVEGRLLNCGQSCIAPKRLIVVPAVFDAFRLAVRERLQRVRMGDPRAATTDLGPMASRRARDQLHRQVRASIRAGARCLLGGRREAGSAFYPPTLLDRVAPGMPAFDEELFGPVVCLVPARDDNHALQLASATRFGLGASLWTADVERARKLARFMPVGMVAINSLVRSDPRLPFGGVKASGFGRELSYHGLREFTAPRTVWVG